MESSACSPLGYYASAEETAAIFSQLKALAENKHCVDCSSPNPQWASVNNGIFICLECSVEHRTLGVQISLVRSLTMDKWTPHQMRYMELGGNKEFLDYLRKQDIKTETKSVDKYKSNLSTLYRESLKAKVNKGPDELKDASINAHSEKSIMSFDSSHLTGMMASVFSSEKSGHHTYSSAEVDLAGQSVESHEHTDDDDILRFNVDISVESMQKGIQLLTTSSKRAASTAATKLQESQIIERLRVSSGKGWSSLHSGWSSAVSSIKKEIGPSPTQAPTTASTSTEHESKMQPTEIDFYHADSSPVNQDISNLDSTQEQPSNDINPAIEAHNDGSVESKASITKKAAEMSSHLLVASGKGWSAMKGYLGQTQAKIKSRSYSDFLGSIAPSKQAPEAISLDSGSSSPASIGRVEHSTLGAASDIEGSKYERQESSAPKFEPPQSQGSPGSLLPVSSTRRKNTRKESASILKVADVQDFLLQLEHPPSPHSESCSPVDTVHAPKSSREAAGPSEAHTKEVSLSNVVEDTESPSEPNDADEHEDWNIVVPPITDKT